MLRLVVMSDTHSMHRAIKEVPAGDVLIHCGDALGHGTLPELQDFVEWFAAQPHKHKLLVAGNHDWIYERNPAAAMGAIKGKGITYLQDASTVIEGLTFYGAPWTPQFYNWAFMLDRGPQLAAKWAQIPDPTHILITHGPPYGHGDLAPFGANGTAGRIVGCLELLLRVRELRPTLHCFGHIHEGRGATRSDEVGTIFVNAAVCDGQYQPINPPVVLDIDPAEVRG